MSHMAGINHDMSNGFLPRLYFREADLQSCRHSRESGNPGFTWYRVRCARSQQLLAVPAPRAGFFGLGPSMVLALRAACGGPNSIPSNLSLLVQRKETKRKHAPDGALLLRSAALGPALTRRDTPCRASQPQASCLRPFGRSPKALRGSGAPCGVLKTPASYLRWREAKRRGRDKKLHDEF